MEEDKKHESLPVIKESDIIGETIIFDIPIKQKLAHVIVTKSGSHYHINLDGEDIGSFHKESNGEINRYEQPKGVHTDIDEYFKPIEAKLAELEPPI
ncbi:hypothetical protein [Pedobacter insulae]|uniref:Uncharacterized protein n=1 Tax=Pedobacter insulae TaxID=414048 RepID=A0A1I2YFH2_9SPHI|nr:hypothetical protein [Pedobacter insulae]SFH23856.1 hypothetical protein SAMN04489864_10735 [Pedobacter insulae]